MKLIFWEKKTRLKLVVLLSLKKLQVLEIILFGKKILPGYFWRYDLQNSVHKFFRKKWVSRYLSFDDFKVQKDCSSQ